MTDEYEPDPYYDRIRKLEADLAAARGERDDALMAKRHADVINDGLKRIADKAVDRIEELLADNTRQVETRRRQDRRAAQLQFAHIAGQPIGRTPALPDEATLRLRFKLMGEEFTEAIFCVFGEPDAAVGIDAWQAWNHLAGLSDYIDVAPIIATEETLPELVKELCDLLYTAEGTAIPMGVDMNKASALVHESNMTKEGAPIVNGKLTKGDAYRAPDVRAELIRQGWRPPCSE